ncbi:MAG: sulfate adenylyltransferase subunit 1 [Burkholderiaceae bacterium]
MNAILQSRADGTADDTSPTTPFGVQEQGLLRFITAGSVDDGKSTLIGRLLFDSKGIFADQLAALSRAKNTRTVGDAVDLSLLTDGLEAEREQGITIDVAYRYFATPLRKFIVADTPGHVQYTRNMVTGASTADAAVVLVDVTRLTFSELNGVLTAGLLSQTKRHTAIAARLGLPAVIFAVNKMDLVGFDQAKFDAARRAVEALATSVGIQETHVLPLSALTGDNVVTASAHTPWYAGAPLLSLLERLPSRADRLGTGAQQCTARFPVQMVARHDGHKADDFRGYMGRLATGALRVGDELRVLPNGQNAQLSRIVRGGLDIEAASAGECLTLVLDRDLDISRGDQLVLAQDAQPPVVGKRVRADICWLDQEALSPARKYLLKHASRTVQAKLQTITYVLDIETLSQSSQTDTVAMNDIARIELLLAQPIVADAYTLSPSTGSFILIDPATNHTVAAGMIVALP